MKHAQNIFDKIASREYKAVIIQCDDREAVLTGQDFHVNQSEGIIRTAVVENVEGVVELLSHPNVIDVDAGDQKYLCDHDSSDSDNNYSATTTMSFC